MTTYFLFLKIVNMGVLVCKVEMILLLTVCHVSLSCEARYINNNKVPFFTLFCVWLVADGCNSLKLHSRWRNLSNGFTGCYCLLLPLVKEVQAIGVRSMFPNLRILRGKIFILLILYPSCLVHFSSLVSLLFSKMRQYFKMQSVIWSLKTC